MFYSQHARNEMRSEQFGAIREHEVYEAASTRAVIEEYPEDQPYPSVLVLGRTSAGRPLHLVCAYAEAEDYLVVVTVYEPDPLRWDEEFRHRRGQ